MRPQRPRRSRRMYSNSRRRTKIRAIARELGLSLEERPAWTTSIDGTPRETQTVTIHASKYRPQYDQAEG